MKIVLGSDHGGFKYKGILANHLKESGYEVIDVGTNSEEPAARSEFGLKAALKVQSGEADLGIVLCKSGQGVCMAANKVKGVYCGLAYNDDNAHLLKEHDGANMMALGASYLTEEELIKRADLFINAKFEGGRHEQRLNILKNYEKDN